MFAYNNFCYTEQTEKVNISIDLRMHAEDASILFFGMISILHLLFYVEY